MNVSPKIRWFSGREKFAKFANWSPFGEISTATALKDSTNSADNYGCQ